MKHYDYILVGSGLYAGVFAWYAKQRGKTCLVLERRDHIGGNVYCEDVEGKMCIRDSPECAEPAGQRFHCQRV